MSKRLVLNGVLALVIVGLAVGVFATVRSSSGSASTTQTVATAKRGVVLQSVTSTGNVEAPKDLSLSFQQSGQVTAIYVAVGEHVNAGPGPRQGRRHRAEDGARVGAVVARIRAGEPRRFGTRRNRDRAAGRRGIGRIGRAVGDGGAVGAHAVAAERGEQRHEVRPGNHAGAAGARRARTRAFRRRRRS